MAIEPGVAPEVNKGQLGGKTGSGDNRFETFNRAGDVLTSRATNRTATFLFYIGDRYYGVITAFVQGREAADYRFTSALPVTILKLLAPTIMEGMGPNQTVKDKSAGAGTGSFAVNGG